MLLKTAKSTKVLKTLSFFPHIKDYEFSLLLSYLFSVIFTFDISTEVKIRKHPFTF